MQTLRRTTPEFTAILLLLLLVGADLQYVASPRPSARDLSEGTCVRR
jgi:hypothetical protein